MGIVYGDTKYDMPLANNLPISSARVNTAIFLRISSFKDLIRMLILPANPINMKNQITSLLTGLLSVLFLLSSCEKNNGPAPKTKTDLIAQGTWKFSAATVGGSDVSGLLQTCQKDNVLTFVAAGSGTVDEGLTKCNMADPQTNPFTWSFASSETILNVSATLFTGGSSVFTVVSLTETQLIVSQNITVGGSTQNAVVTFIH
jgi:hypothetical protein